MWREICAVLAALLLATAPFWNGYSSLTDMVVLNIIIAVQVLYLALSSLALRRYNAKHGTHHMQRRWLMYIAAFVGAAGALICPIMGHGTNLTACRDGLVFGAAIFLFSLWGAMAPAVDEYEDEEQASTRSFGAGAQHEVAPGA